MKGSPLVSDRDDYPMQAHILPKRFFGYITATRETPSLVDAARTCVSTPDICRIRSKQEIVIRAGAKEWLAGDFPPQAIGDHHRVGLVKFGSGEKLFTR